MLRLWKKSPALRILLPFCAGILIQKHFLFHVNTTVVLSLIAFATYLIVFVKIRSWRFRYRYVSGVSMSALYLSFGLSLCALSNEVLYKADFISHFRDGDGLLVTLNDESKSRVYGDQVEVKIEGLLRGSTWIPCDGKIQLTVQSDSVPIELHAGEQYLIQGRPVSLAGSLIPNGFDYAAWQASKGITKQITIRRNDLMAMECDPSWSSRVALIQFREYLIDQFRAFNPDDREFWVLVALVLGKTDFIDAELMSSYSSAGAVHVLAVSGLHVGLIYVVLAPLLRLVFPGEKRKWVKFLLPALILWFYAGVTGFSPSVLRSAVMFSVFIVADTWKLKGQAYNTMSVSALLLVLWQPEMLTNLGFLLSYLAVGGIVILQRKVSGLFTFKSVILQKTWELMSVSLCAQIATMPLSLYYFHQFPTYFLLANMLVVPISTVILYAGLLFLLFYWFVPVGHLALNVASSCTWIMNEIIAWCDTLPHSLIRHLAITGFEAVILFILFWMLGRAFFWTSKWAWRGVLAALIMLVCSQIWEWHRTAQQNVFAILPIKHHTCIVIAEGREVYLIVDDSLQLDEHAMLKSVDPFLDPLDADHIYFIPLDTGFTSPTRHFKLEDRLLLFDQYSIQLADSTFWKSSKRPLARWIYLLDEPVLQDMKAEDKAYLSSQSIICSSSSKTAVMRSMLRLTTDIYWLKEGLIKIEDGMKQWNGKMFIP